MKVTEEQKASYIQLLNHNLNVLSGYCPELQRENGNLIVKAGNKQMLILNKKSISTPYGFALDAIFTHPGGLIDEDEYISEKQVKELLEEIKRKGGIKRINHIGFCYKTDSIEQEVKIINKASKAIGLHMYELKSADAASWFFAGDASNWRDPMLEFVLVEGEVNFKDKDYWLPGLHINIDTSLSFEDIAESIDLIFKGSRDIAPMYYGKYITQVRVWVGAVSGINLHLDIGTFAQNARYTRKVMLEER